MNIVFAHNVYDRFATLKDTITIERNIFPDSKISVAHNTNLINVFYNFKDIQFIQFNEKPHKIGCVNGCVLSIQQLLNTDFDVLIFSHDDVYINNEYIDVVKKNIESIHNGEYDIICRMPRGWGKYYMMEVFYISKKAVVELFNRLTTIKDENIIPADLHGSISPEVWLYNLLSSKEFKINEIEFESRLSDYNHQLGKMMGYYHKNIGIRGWRD